MEAMITRMDELQLEVMKPRAIHDFPFQPPTFSGVGISFLVTLSSRRASLKGSMEKKTKGWKNQKKQYQSKTKKYLIIEGNDQF